MECALFVFRIFRGRQYLPLDKTGVNQIASSGCLIKLLAIAAMTICDMSSTEIQAEDCA